MERASRTLEADDRANELYWGSDRSVNQIAEELDLSKGAFYGMIRPLAAGLGCPTCGREVAHTNRTARERSLVDCPACGWEGAEGDTLPEYIPPGSPAPRAVGPRSGATRVWSRPLSSGWATVRDRAASWSPERSLAAGALLGGAVGLALVLWARRR
jgi:endogenous inhibitor of DNA gyrase (YacG/DUF329 family)